LSFQDTDLAQRVELLREVLPDLRRLAIMINVGSSEAVQEMNRPQFAVSLPYCFA
jgi:hypothetical protein